MKRYTVRVVNCRPKICVEYWYFDRYHKLTKDLNRAQMYENVNDKRLLELLERAMCISNTQVELFTYIEIKPTYEARLITPEDLTYIKLKGSI